MSQFQFGIHLIKGKELEGKVVLIKKSYFKKDFNGDRRFMCEGGFGCSPDLIGTKIFGFFVSDGEKCYVRRSDVEGIVI